MRTQVRISGDAHGLEDRLISRVQTLETEIQRMAQMLAATVPSEGEEDERKGRAILDAPWKCKKCAALLGFYDVETDVLRIRYKDHVTFVRVGEGGFIQVICRGCGDINTQEYTTQDEIDESRKGAVKRGSK